LGKNQEVTKNDGGIMKTKYLVMMASLVCGLLIGAMRANAAETSVICTPTGVATFSSRIHVRCAQSFSGIVFFAYRSSDSAGAARYMSIATSALISGRNIRIFYDPADLTGAGIGCQTHDCRLLTGLEVL
jgi:hypothetical protein